MMNNISLLLPVLYLITSSSLFAADRNLQLRVERVERMLEQQVTSSLNNRVNELQKENQELRSLLEEQTYQHNKLKKRIHSLYEDMDRRIMSMESGNSSVNKRTNAHPDDLLEEQKNSDSGARVSTNSANIIPSVTTTITQPVIVKRPATTLKTIDNTAIEEVSVKSPTGKNRPKEQVYDEEHKYKEQQTYKAAFNALKSARYAKAEQAFSNFLMQYPDGRYSVIARYWLAETNYIQRKFNQAIRSYTTILQAKPKSTKYNEAKLKIAYCYFELKKIKQAEKIAKQLIAEAPKSTEAKQAKYLLKQIR